MPATSAPPEILEALAAIAPVYAVRGNNDHGAWARALPERRIVTAGAVRLLVLHDLHELGDGEASDAGARVVVTGHSHQPKIERRDGLVFFNPGSAGPRRFRLPVAVAMVRVRGERVFARIRELAVSGPAESPAPR